MAVCWSKEQANPQKRHSPLTELRDRERGMECRPQASSAPSTEIHTKKKRHNGETGEKTEKQDAEGLLSGFLLCTR